MNSIHSQVTPRDRVQTNEEAKYNYFGTSGLRKSVKSITKNFSTHQDSSQKMRVTTTTTFKKGGSYFESKCAQKSIDQTKSKGHQFDFSDIGKLMPTQQYNSPDLRVQSAYFQKSRKQQYLNLLDKKQALSTIQQEVFGHRNQFNKNQIRRAAANLLMNMQKDFDLQIVCKQLFINQQKLLNILTMIAPSNLSEDSDTMHFLCIHKKLVEQLKDLTDSVSFNRPLYLIELDRFYFILQFLSIPIALPCLTMFIQLTGSMTTDSQLGMIVNYVKLFSFVKMVLAQIKQNTMDQLSQSTAPTEDDQDRSSSPLAKNRSIKKKAFYKMRRLGYLNEPNINEFYDSYADLIKTTGSDLNAKQYVFSHLNYGHISLENHRVNDKYVQKEVNAFGLEARPHLPMWIQSVYKHKVHGAEQLLTKIYYYLPSEDQLIQEQRDFSNKCLYIMGTNLANLFDLVKTDSLLTEQSPSYNLEPLRTIKGQVLDDVELFSFTYKYQFSTNCEYEGRHLETDYQINTEVSSDSEQEEETYDPLFVKRIMSYPVWIIQQQIRDTFPLCDRFNYKRFDQEYDLSKIKIKPAFQFKENFVGSPTEENGRYCKNYHHPPDVELESDESENEIDEDPLDALDQWNESEQIKYTYVKKEAETKNLLKYQFLKKEGSKHYLTTKTFLRSDSSAISDDNLMDKRLLNKVLHPMAPMQVEFQESESIQTFDRDSVNIKTEVISSNIETKVFIKEVVFDGDTPIPYRKLEFESHQRILQNFNIQEIESEEDPSFDEEPINVELPEVVNVIESEQVSERQNHEESEDMDKYFEGITDVHILPMTHENGVQELRIDVKDQTVSSLQGIDYEGQLMWEIRFYLGEKQRKRVPQQFNINLEGKSIRSIQVNVCQMGNKVYMKLFGLLAVVDQRVEEELLKKKDVVKKRKVNNGEIEHEDEIHILEVQDHLTLPPNWQKGQFLIHLQYSPLMDYIEKLTINLNWLKTVITRFFPDVIFIENEIDSPGYDQFESYIFGVGPLSRRDGQHRIILFKRELEDWETFFQHFQFRSLIMLDSLCVITSLYGTVQAMGLAQAKFMAEHTKGKGFTQTKNNQQYAYKYLDNAHDIFRPTTGLRPKSVKMNVRQKQD